LGASAEGANTNPPCASPPAVPTTQLMPAASATPRNTGQALRQTGTSWSGWLAASSSCWRSMPRQSLAKAGICEARNITAVIAPRPAVRSRLRATWPCSRAFWRRRGDAFSVLPWSAMDSPASPSQSRLLLLSLFLFPLLCLSSLFFTLDGAARGRISLTAPGAATVPPCESPARTAG